MAAGGFYIQKNSIPAVIRWIEYLSLLYWAFMGLTINDFRWWPSMHSALCLHCEQKQTGGLDGLKGDLSEGLLGRGLLPMVAATAACH
jgi:hypothetical protein